MTLHNHNILRWFFIPTVLGGCIFFWEGIKRYFLPTLPIHPVVNTILGWVWIFTILFWIFGSYLSQKDQIKPTGIAGLLAILTGHILIAIWFWKSDFSDANMKAEMWNAMNRTLFVWGILMFGTSTLTSRRFPSMAVTLWMAGLLIGNAMMGFQWQARNFLVAAGLIWCGIHFWFNQPDRQKTHNTVSESKSLQRLKTLDLFRGLIMIFMALDHACLMIVGKHSTEYWNHTIAGYSDGVAFLTRFITHFCAPGFFFIMGTGMVLYAISRQKRGWTHNQIMGNLAVRGVILIVLEQLLWVPILFGSIPLTRFNVLFGLGGAMVIGTLFIKMNRFALLGLGMAGLLLTQVLPQFLTDLGYYNHPLATLFLVPQVMGNWFNMYPVFPWLCIALVGMAFGKELVVNSNQAYRKLLYVGVSCLALFPIIRWIGGFGNFQAPAGSGWIEFLNMIKYPPSLVFLLWTLGVNFVFIFLIEKYHDKLGNWINPLLVFGKTALYFYFTHWFLFASTASLFYMHIQGDYAWLYAAWAVGLALLYPVCKRYLEFKQDTPLNSVWRMI